MTSTTIGREPVQIVEIRQPLCANVYGTAPCTATGGVDAKCYNTRGSCQDTANYRHKPEDPLAADRTYSALDTLTNGDFTRGQDLFFAVYLRTPASPDGCIWEMGATGKSIYLGVTSSNLVFRAGNGATGHPTDTAKVSVAASAYAGKTGVFYGAVDNTAKSVTLWWWDARQRTLAQVGTDTAAVSWGTNWSSNSDGGCGYVDGTTAVGESTSNFNGVIETLKVYDSQAAPDMTASFVQSLYFSSGAAAERGVSGADYVIPSLVSVGTSPARVNLAGANPDLAGVGLRSECRVTFMDHPHTDRIVDPYIGGRTFDPMTRGHFWTKWLTRNLHRNNVIIRIYEGYSGEALSAMTSRQYFLTGASAITDDGKITLTGQDILGRVQTRKAKAPVASPGTIYTAIDDVVLSVEVDNATVGDYAASGTLRIGSEVMTYSSVATSSNGITFTLTARGTDGSTAAAHAVDETAQQCLRFTAQTIDQACVTLMETYAGIDTGFMDIAAWETEITTYLQNYVLTTLVTVPTSVQEMLAELQEQCQFFLWWDERDQLLKIKAIRGVDADPPSVTDAANILPGLSITEKPRQRISQVYLYYGLRDYAGSLTDTANYQYSTVTANLESESDALYGEASVKEVFSRWLGSEALAATTSDKIVNRYKETPREARFEMDAKDRAYWVGDTIKISHYLDVDEFGEKRARQWIITSAEESVPGHTVRYTAEDSTLYGKVFYILASGAANYPGAATVGFGDAYAGDTDGELSDGETCARIN